ncbi:hypothetical protein R3P38DRAFT_2759643 [Favolaschia claudopus]|uniref:Uncharacterized protein n=1 Tax=Favolaschia claudopus TaxID=2862362 RepID=A0AAW0E0K0_9AGAR
MSVQVAREGGWRASRGVGVNVNRSTIDETRGRRLEEGGKRWWGVVLGLAEIEICEPKATTLQRPYQRVTKLTSEQAKPNSRALFSVLYKFLNLLAPTLSVNLDFKTVCVVSTLCGISFVGLGIGFGFGLGLAVLYQLNIGLEQPWEWSSTLAFGFGDIAMSDGIFDGVQTCCPTLFTRLRLRIAQDLEDLQYELDNLHAGRKARLGEYVKISSNILDDIQRLLGATAIKLGYTKHPARLQATTWKSIGSSSMMPSIRACQVNSRTRIQGKNSSNILHVIILGTGAPAAHPDNVRGDHLGWVILNNALLIAPRI